MDTGLVAKPPKMDGVNAEAEIKKIKEGLGDLSIRLSANLVTTQEEYDRGVLQIKEGNMAIKKFEAKEDELVNPHKKYIASIHDPIKAICDVIRQGIKTVKKRGNKFIHDENECKAKEVAKLQAQKAKVEEKVIVADTAKEQAKGLNKVAAIENKIETVAAQTTGGSAKRRKFRITDESLIPREYLTPDEKKIREKGGKISDPLPEVPGIEFYDEEGMRG